MIKHTDFFTYAHHQTKIIYRKNYKKPRWITCVPDKELRLQHVQHCVYWVSLDLHSAECLPCFCLFYPKMPTWAGTSRISPSLFRQQIASFSRQESPVFYEHCILGSVQVQTGGYWTRIWHNKWEPLCIFETGGEWWPGAGSPSDRGQPQGQRWTPPSPTHTIGYLKCLCHLFFFLANH